MTKALFIWWCWQIAVEGEAIYRRWAWYNRIFAGRRRWAHWLATALYLLVAPGLKIYQIAKPLLLGERYRVQLEIEFRDHTRIRIERSVERVSDGVALSLELIERDRSIIEISYQVVSAYEDGRLP
jgi:hypothetical protein